MDKQNNAHQLLLQIDMGDILDLDQINQLTHQLKDEISEKDVFSVDFISEDSTPDGAKAADAVTWGMLGVSVLPSVLPMLIEFLQKWTMRGESRKLKVKAQNGDQLIELEYSPESVSNKELKELVSIIQAGMKENTDKSEKEK